MMPIVCAQNNVCFEANISPISQLPVELLEAIFTLLFEEDKVDTAMATSSDIVTQICHRWRHVALVRSRLWRRILVNDTTALWMVEERLRRSKNARLRVKVTGATTSPTADILPLVRAIAAHSGRIEHFELSGYDSNKTIRILAELRHPAPILESIHLEAEIDDAEPPHVLAAARTIHLFGGQMPAVKRVSTISMPLSLAPFSGLRRLDLRDQASLSTSELVSVLRRSPELEVLVLGIVERIWSDNTTYPTATVDLPCLEFLLLAGLQDDVLHTVAHITFPATTEVDLRMIGNSSSERDMTRHCHSLRSIASTLQDITFAYSDMADEDNHVVSMSTPDERLTVSWEWDMEREDNAEDGQPSLRFELMSLPAVRSVRIVGLSQTACIAQAEWQRFLNLMPSLQSIEFATSSEPFTRLDVLSPMLEALSQPVAHLGKLDVVGLRCPDLRTVWLSDASWGTPDADMTQAFVAYVGARLRYGMKQEFRVDFSTR